MTERIPVVPKSLPDLPADPTLIPGVLVSWIDDVLIPSLAEESRSLRALPNRDPVRLSMIHA